VDSNVPEHVVWPAQADCGGHVWTRTASREAEGLLGYLVRCVGHHTMLPGEVRSLIPSLIQLRPPGFVWPLSAVPPQVADDDDPR
jgi:hypothetical protein